MSTDVRPVCIYAMPCLKKNTTKLVIAMCFGIALALYGVYVKARMSTSAAYKPGMSVATNWLYESVSHKIMNPSSMLAGCGHSKGPAHRMIHSLSAFVGFIVGYSGYINGLINVTQLILLKLYGQCCRGINAIISLSAFGGVISLICLIGSFSSCKLMCISCLGIQHALIIYYAIKRKNLLKQMICPPSSLTTGRCSLPGASSIPVAKRDSDSLRRRAKRSS